MFKPVLSGMTLAITTLAAFQPTHAFAQSSSASPVSGAASAPVTVAQANAAGATAATAEPTQTVEVTTRIKRLNDARTGIQT